MDAGAVRVQTSRFIQTFVDRFIHCVVTTMLDLSFGFAELLRTQNLLAHDDLSLYCSLLDSNIAQALDIAVQVVPLEVL